MSFLDILQYYYETDPIKIFPLNFTKQDIINYIGMLRDNCNEKDKDIFNDFITIINDGKVDFSNSFNSNAKVDPNVLTTSGVSLMKFTAKQENNE